MNQGAEHIVVFSFFLSPGHQSRIDIPGIVKNTILDGKLGVTYFIAQPVGTNPMIIELLQRRVQHAMGD